MAVFVVTYLLNGKEFAVRVAATDENAAGKSFNASNPNVPPENIREVVKIDDESPVFLSSLSINIFIKDLFGGNLGLAMTYWVYGVLAGFVWGAVLFSLQLEPGSELAQVFAFSMLAYYFVVYVGIWRAATKYAGNRLWGILAKFVIVITVLPTIIRFLR